MIFRLRIWFEEDSERQLKVPEVNHTGANLPRQQAFGIKLYKRRILRGLSNWQQDNFFK